MRITEAQLRKIVRQEAGRLIREAPVRGMDVTKFIAADGEEWTEAEILASMEGEFLELGGDSLVFLGLRIFARTQATGGQLEANEGEQER